MSEREEMRTAEVEIAYNPDEFDIVAILEYLHEHFHHVDDVSLPPLDYRYDVRENVADCPECGAAVHESWGECLVCGLTTEEAWFA